MPEWWSESRSDPWPWSRTLTCIRDRITPGLMAPFIRRVIGGRTGIRAFMDVCITGRVATGITGVKVTFAFKQRPSFVEGRFYFAPRARCSWGSRLA